MYGDSALVIHQVNSEWDTRHPKLIPYKVYVLDLAIESTEINFTHIPQEESQKADALATLSAMFKESWPN